MEGVLRLISDTAEEMFPLTRIGAYRKLYAPKYFAMEDYFPSVVVQTVKRLARKGMVEIKEAGEGKVVILTEKGKRGKLFYNLKNMLPKKGIWDGKWRVVIFDIDEKRKGKRNFLRKYLTQLGFRQWQKSVWINPYDCTSEIKYLREVLEVPHEVKFGVMEWVEDEDEIKKWFDL